MPHCIAHAFEPLLRILCSSEGRHRRADRRSAAVRTGNPGVLVTQDRQKARRRHARRRALWLAVHGVDVGPRLIHRGEVTA